MMPDLATTRLGQRNSPMLDLDTSRFRRLWTTYKRWRARRRTERILSGLSEHALKDIGITFHEIGSVVDGTPGERLHRYDACWDEPAAKSSQKPKPTGRLQPCLTST